MVYAQILNGEVVNIIVLDDPSLEKLFLEGPEGIKYDSIIRVDDKLDADGMQPGIGHTFDGKQFLAAAPTLIEKTDEQLKMEELESRIQAVEAAVVKV